LCRRRRLTASAAAAVASAPAAHGLGLAAAAVAEGHRVDAEVQGGHLAAGPAAEHDLGGARPEPGQGDAEGVGVLAVGVEAKSPAHRGHRDLPPDGELAAVGGELDAAEHPGLGSVSTPGPREYQPRWSRHAHGRSGTSVRGRSSGSPRRLRRTALATGPGAARGLNGPVFANAMTPIPSPGASTMAEWKPFHIPS
jgi:hypothetical protein